MALVLAAQLVGFNPHDKALDKKFILLSVATVVATVVDVEATRGCIARGTCRERNYLMGPLIMDRKKIYAAQTLAVVCLLFVSYKFKERGRKEWWIAPTVLTTGHGVLAGIAIRF